MHPQKVSVIGLGKMGSVLASRLLQHGFDVTVYNRTPSKMQPLIAQGAIGVSALQDAAMNADVVLSCVLDDNAILEVTQSILSTLKPGAIHIGASTIMPNTSKTLAELHQKQGSIYVAGNVLGIPKAAEKGLLTSIVAGDTEAISKCKPLFQSYSTKIINVGDQPFLANVMKICCNYFLITAIESMGELYTFAEKSGLEAHFLADFFHEVFAHAAFKLYVDKIKDRNFEPNFALSGGFKDMKLFQQAFTDVLVTPDIANLVKNKLTMAMALGMEQEDWSAVTKISRIQAGLKD